ncbi:hypothetical protein L3Q82_006341 [Scortum barcoo]|uniref:Uncharacterized protein n=1 Tax=Scortum barcoo TaxID=214431 RepID=A0ACB8WZ88_9TELE|nr:hypothetical protein L3Q82_006341 [Scortum barcoo]
MGSTTTSRTSSPHKRPAEFEDLVDLAIRIDNRLQERESERESEHRRAAKRSSETQGGTMTLTFCLELLFPKEDCSHLWS